MLSSSTLMIIFSMSQGLISYVSNPYFLEKWFASSVFPQPNLPTTPTTTILMFYNIINFLKIKVLLG